MKWRGIRRDSIDIGNADEGLLAINTRFKVNGEMRRRRGLARTSIQRKTAAVTTISGFSAFQSNVMAALTDGDRIQGYQQPYSLWGDGGVLNGTYAEIIGLNMPEYSCGTLDQGEHDFNYVSGAILWNNSPTTYAATRADIIQVVGLQIYYDGGWKWFSDESDQSVTAAGAEALALGKSIRINLTTSQEVKMRFYDGGPSNNSGSIIVRFK